MVDKAHCVKAVFEMISQKIIKLIFQDFAWKIPTNCVNLRSPGNVFKYPLLTINPPPLEVVVVLVITTECDIFCDYVGCNEKITDFV